MQRPSQSASCGQRARSSLAVSVHCSTAATFRSATPKASPSRYGRSRSAPSSTPNGAVSLASASAAALSLRWSAGSRRRCIRRANSDGSTSVIAQKLHWKVRPSSATSTGQSDPAPYLRAEVEVDGHRLPQHQRAVDHHRDVPVGVQLEELRRCGCRRRRSWSARSRRGRRARRSSQSGRNARDAGIPYSLIIDASVARAQPARQTSSSGSSRRGVRIGSEPVKESGCRAESCPAEKARGRVGRDLLRRSEQRGDGTPYDRARAPRCSGAGHRSRPRQGVGRAHVPPPAAIQRSAL